MTDTPRDPASEAAYFASIWGLSNAQLQKLELAFRSFAVAPAPALPEGKPVAWRSKDDTSDPTWELTPFEPIGGGRIREPLYASPVQVDREGADDPAEELRKRLETMHGDQLRYFFGMGRFEGVPDEELRKTILAFFYPASRIQP